MAGHREHIAKHRRIARMSWLSVMGLASLLTIACSGGESQGSGQPACQGSSLGFPLCGANPQGMEAVLTFPALRFDRPTFLTHAPDDSDRIFVLEQGGKIHVFPNSPTVMTTKVFLDIASKQKQPVAGEEGLLGLAFDPQYRTNGYFYIHYIAGSPSRSVIARYQVNSTDPDLADLSSEKVLLEVNQPASNHNGGMLAFGPDDLLYISFGDGGGAGDTFANGQNRATLLGTILRIDPHSGTNYGIPSDNPFFGEGGGVREEIWAYGLRHPWRFSFDRQTGALWLGDVGQGEREEIDIIVKGGNYGWPIFEGMVAFANPGQLPPAAFDLPLIDHVRMDSRSITGGYVYRGNRLSELRGSYLYGDFATGKVWALVESGGMVQTHHEITNVASLSSFGEDQQGEIYMLSYGSGTVWTLDRRQGQGANAFPSMLSKTGIFSDTAQLTAAPSLLEYSIQSPLWSDHALKRRWIHLPAGSQIDYHDSQAWRFPLGTVLVKHFELEMTRGTPSSARRLETRVLVKEQAGWAGYTYRWNTQQDDAVLLGGRSSDTFTIQDSAAPGGTRQQTWTYPSRTDCLQCHTPAHGMVLGPRTLQLNHAIQVDSQPKNQLTHWSDLDMFSSSIGDPALRASYVDPHDTSAPLDYRARSYLAANCAMCHVPGGPAPGDMDMRYLTTPAAMNLLDMVPTQGDLGLTTPRRILPGTKESSVLWERLRRTDGYRMPSLGSIVVDQDMVTLIGAWIDQM